MQGRDYLLMYLLDCKGGDLACIDGICYDWKDIFGIFPDCDLISDLSIEMLMTRAFSYSIYRLRFTVRSRIESLQKREMYYDMSEEQEEELAAIEELDPCEDIEFKFNYLASSVICNKHGSAYRRYFDEALDEFRECFGLEIQLAEEVEK